VAGSKFLEGDEDDSSLEDQTAYEIFKATEEVVTNGKKETPNEGVWASLHAPLRHGVVDGRKVVFELVTAVTNRPKVNRKQRITKRDVIINSDRSSMEYRLRFYLMHFRVGTLSVAFFACFVVLNLVFGAFFYALEGGCCGADLTFEQNFAFAVQTSATIGYGSFSPAGMWQNFLVMILTYASILINTIFAGLLFTKYVTPVINIQFSDVLTLCNVNGVPCLSFRVGNADGYENPLTDINVRLTYSYQIPYTDHKGDPKYFRQTENLNLLSTRQHGLKEVWTLRHVLDESSPLFGLNFEEHPANKIYVFTISIDAVQELTKNTVNVQEEYQLQDILIGHTFSNQMEFDHDHDTRIWDYSKMSDTEPYPVWYPAKAGVYETERPTPPRSFGPT
jgi:inward rectifier potassium channel